MAADKAHRKPGFFCDSCGAEVAWNAKVCPKCGKFFTSVRCPRCGFSGDSQLFKNGCPHCGYAVADVHEHKHEKKPADGLPIWVYVVAATFFVCAAAAFFLFALKKY
jgi:predicted amidophosphoribosyltransferase